LGFPPTAKYYKNTILRILDCGKMDSDNTATEKAGRDPNKKRSGTKLNAPVPGLLVAHAPEGTVSIDRCQIPHDPFVVGRGTDADFPIAHRFVSSRHFQILKESSRWMIEDLDSTNGTFVNGVELIGKRNLPSPCIIRAGEAVLVFHASAADLFPSPTTIYGMVGKFHVSQIIEDLKDAAKSDRHILLAGPSGSGKELATNALASMMSDSPEPLTFTAFNAARFSTSEQVTATLFGVAPRVFSGVDARPGLIERASGGLFFVDEAHNLPESVQRTLLRIFEDGKFSRIGDETKSKKVDLRFVLASNAPAPTYGLAHDILARLRVVHIPPLSERLADIPSIFNHLLVTALKKQGLRLDILNIFEADDYEILCLDSFEDKNVRDLIDITDRIATRIASGTPPEEAAIRVFDQRFSQNPVVKRNRKTTTHTSAPPISSPLEGLEPRKTDATQNRHQFYDKHKELIIKVFNGAAGRQIATTSRILLEQHGLKTTRHSLTVNLTKWGVTGD